jgi:hypothetical protein
MAARHGPRGPVSGGLYTFDLGAPASRAGLALWGANLQGGSRVVHTVADPQSSEGTVF